MLVETIKYFNVLNVDVVESLGSAITKNMLPYTAPSVPNRPTNSL